jgi:hypothetical protein
MPQLGKQARAALLSCMGAHSTICNCRKVACCTKPYSDVITFFCPVCACAAVCAAPAQVSIGTDPYAVFNDADWALMIGAKPRGPGQERADLLDQNGRIFVDQVRCSCCSYISYVYTGSEGRVGWVSTCRERAGTIMHGELRVAVLRSACVHSMMPRCAERCLDMLQSVHAKRTL